MRSDSQRRRTSWALGLSLVLHAAVLLFLWWREKPEAVQPARHEAIELNIVELEPPKAPPREVTAPKPAAQPPAPQQKKVERPSTAPKVAAKVPMAAPAAGASSPAAPKSGAAGPADAPKSIALVPGGDFAVGSAGDPEGPRGHTITNSPDEQPDPVAMREYTQEKLSRRFGATVEGMVADTKVRNGLVHPYFMGARSAMENDLSSGPVPGRKDLVRAGVKSYLATQERYGKTGNPFAAGDRYAEETANLSLARTATSGPAFAASDVHAAGEVAKAEQQMAAMHVTMGALDHALLTAVLEIVQEPSGGVADAHIVKSSGDRKFDEHVLHRARKVFLKLEDPPAEGQGISPDGWRTLWRFSYFPPSANELRGQRVRVELLRIEKGMGSGNPLEHADP